MRHCEQMKQIEIEDSDESCECVKVKHREQIQRESEAICLNSFSVFLCPFDVSF